MQIDTSRTDSAERAPSLGAGARGWLWTAAAALVAVHVWISLHLAEMGPLVLHDEGGYLGNATFMVRGYGHPLDGYYGGYSLLLLPAAVLRSDPHGYYAAALMTNALLALVTAALAFLLVRQLFPIVSASGASLVAAAVVLQPLAFEIAHLAMSENALIPATLLAALLLARYVECPTVRMGIASGVAASLAFWISPRGLVVVAAILVAHVFLSIRGRLHLAWFAAITTTMAGSIAVSFFFNRWLRGGSPVPGVAGAAKLPPLTQITTWRDVIAVSGGRFAYFGVATFGLGLVGLGVSVARVLEHRTSTDPPGAVCVVSTFASATVIATIGWSSLTVPVTRIDLLYYGRYVEGVAMPLVVLGGGWLVSRSSWRDHKRSLVGIAVAASGVIVAGAELARLFPKAPPAWTEGSINVLAVFAVRQLTHTRGFSSPLLLGALITGAVLFVGVIHPRLPLLGLVILLAILNAIISSDFEHPFSVSGKQNQSVVESVQRLARSGLNTRCIAYDPSVESQWPLADYVFLMPRWRFVLLGPRTGAQCRALVLTENRPTGSGNWKLISSDAAFLPSPNVPATPPGFRAQTNLWLDLDAIPASQRRSIAEATH